MPGVQCGEIEEQGIGYQDERRVQECDSRLGLGTCEIDVAVIRSAGKRLPRGRLRLASTQFLAQARKALDYMQLVRLRLRLLWHSRIFADGEPVDREFGLVIGKLEISSRAVSLLRCLLGNGARDFSLRFIRKLRKDEPVAHTAEVEHEAVRQVGVEVDGDSRASVRAITRQDCIGVFGSQFEDAVGVAFQREKMPTRVGLLRLGLGCELAGELPATHLVDHPAPFLVERLARSGTRRQTGVYFREVHETPLTSGSRRRGPLL